MTVTDTDLTHPTLLHPRTGEPLRAVGVLPSGRVIWPIMGGDGTEGDANQTGSAGDEGGGDTGQQDGGQASDDNGESDDDSAVVRSREAARYRTQLRAQEQRTSELETQLQTTNDLLGRLRSAITGETEGGDGDPAEQVTELTTTVDTLRSENATLRAELLVHNLAGDHNANATALLDSRGFLTTLQGLDPEGDDYRTEVADAIKDAVAKNAAYRTGQGSGRGGGELSGEQREQQRQRPAGGLAGAVSAALGGK